MAALAAFILPKLSSDTIKMLAMMVAIFGLVAVGAIGQRKIDDGRYNALRAQYAQAQAVAANAALELQQSYDNDAALSAQKDQQRQLALSSDMAR